MSIQYDKNVKKNVDSGDKNMDGKLFPTDLPSSEWVEFSAKGFSESVVGVIHRKSFPATCGMPLGGISTGCIDLETSGMWGYCSIFNTHVPRRGPLNLPFLGLGVDGKTWVLCDSSQVKKGQGTYQKSVECAEIDFQAKGVRIAEEVHYWGHYPVADIEYDTDAPINVGLRAWTPFIPGDVAASNTPAAVFEVHLRSESDKEKKGTIIFSFPGPEKEEADGQELRRRKVKGKDFNGIEVKTSSGIGYVLGVIGEDKLRLGGSCNVNVTSWAKIEDSLPSAQNSDPGSSLAVDFQLQPGERKIIRLVLAWYSPEWHGEGISISKPDFHYLTSYSPRPEWGIGEASTTGGNTYTHMYAARYDSALSVANYIARNHSSLLKRILAWQQAIYVSKELPAWLRESLVNILHLITEDSLWAKAEPPIGEWCRKEDGLFGLLEDPRNCPQVECIPCSFLGNIPLVYFFSQLALSTLRGYKAYMFPKGEAPWVFGGCTVNSPPCEMAMPSPGYQTTLNGPCYVDMMHRYWLCTGDEEVLREFYPSVKKNTIFTMNLRPSYGPDGIISMPTGNVGNEWFEGYEWYGMVAHVGGIHLANLKMAERMAEKMGDKNFAQQCREWFKQGSASMEKKMWAGKYYLTYYEPETGKKSDLIFAYQLDGEWMVRFHGLTSVFQPDRIKITLDTIKQTCVALTRYGAVNFTNPDGSPTGDLHLSEYGGFSVYRPYAFFVPEVLMLGMTYIYEGEQDLGLELARRCWDNIVLRHGLSWDQPNLIRGDTGEQTYGNDYYQNMMLWALPAAMQGKDLSAVCAPGKLVDRVIQAQRSIR